MTSALSPSDKCGSPWGQHGYLRRGVGCMAKGICLIQSNKTNNYNANSFIYFYLVRVGSGLPGYISSLSPPVPGGICEGVGVQGSAACDQKFVMYPPPLVWWRSGGLVWGLENIYLLLQSPQTSGGYIMGSSGRSGGRYNWKRSGINPYFSGYERGTLATSFCLI